MSSTLTHAAFGDSWDVDFLEDKVRMEALEKLGFSQLCNPDSKSGIGRKKGDTIKYNFLPSLSRSFTVTPVSEGVPLPLATTSPVTASANVEEYGVKMQFTSRYIDLGIQTDVDHLVKLLADDIARTEDILAYDQCVKAAWKYVFNSTANAFSTNGTPGATTDENLTYDNLFDLATVAEENNIPTFDGENYVYVSTPEHIRFLQKQDKATSIVKEENAQAALNGEIGVVSNVRLVKDNLPGLVKTIATSFKEGFLVGGDAIMRDYVIEPTIRMWDEEGGRLNNVSWDMQVAHQLIYRQSIHKEERIIHQTSA